ncbi:MAG: hypothetical protein M1836_004650 [Candelina mexicana]|nr:MAG: hypothetical protein M1836_004650 [Candelina mexicana]
MHPPPPSSFFFLSSLLLSSSLLFLLVPVSCAKLAQHDRRGNVPSVPESTRGVTCEESTGNLDYYDCLRTIWTIPDDQDQTSYKGEKILFPPAGKECAIAIFPFPSLVLGKVDLTSWHRLKVNGAAKIAAQCQRGKDPGIGGFDYGFGSLHNPRCVYGNTGMLMFKLPRPESAAANAKAHLPTHSWEVLYHYMYALNDPNYMPADTDPNQVGSSSSGPGTSENFNHIMAQITAEWYDPINAPLGSGESSISPLVTHPLPSDDLGTFPGGSSAMLAFEQEMSGGEGSSSGSCGLGYCLTGADCNGCGECFAMTQESAMSILFGIAHFFARLGRCLKGVEGGIAGSGSGPGKRRTV